MIDTMTRTHRTPHDPLHDAGQFFASLPGLLGFYPEDSVIFAAFEATATEGRYRLGPVLRMDVVNHDMMPHVLSSLKDHDFPTSMVMSFIISDREPDDITTVAMKILEVAVSQNIPLEGCWWAEHILQGEPYCLIIGPHESLPAPWVSGVIAPVTQTSSMRQLTDLGELPEINREDTFRHLARDNRHISELEAEHLASFARRYAIELVDRISDRLFFAPYVRGGQWDTVGGIVLDVGYLLSEIEEQDLSVENIMENTEELITTAIFLSATMLRDTIFEDLIARPGPAARLMLAVARTFGGEVRANALCSYALAYVHMGLNMRALPACALAVEEFPQHELSALLWDYCRNGRNEELVTSVRQSSRDLRLMHGIDDPGLSDAAA